MGKRDLRILLRRVVKEGRRLRVAVGATTRRGAHVIHRVGVFGSAGIAKRHTTLVRDHDVGRPNFAYHCGVPLQYVLRGIFLTVGPRRIWGRAGHHHVFRTPNRIVLVSAGVGPRGLDPTS